MHFGLCNVPATFERLMELVFRGLCLKFCLVYFDDVIVYGKTFDETLHRLIIVWDRFRAAGLTMKPKKCRLFQTEVSYLGHTVSRTGLLQIHTRYLQCETDVGLLR